MTSVGLIDAGIRAAGNRFMLCVLASQRAKQIYYRRRNTDGGMGSAIKQALSEVIRGQVRFTIRDERSNKSFLPTSLVSWLPRLAGANQSFLEQMEERAQLRGAEEPHLADYTLLSLYALGRINLEDNGRAFVGKTYSAEVGVSSQAMEEFEAQPFNITVQSRSERLPFDFMIHLTGNLELIGDWHRHLLYDPLDADLQSVNFQFRVIEQGPNQVDVDCYYRRRWLRAFQFSFDSVEVQLLEPAA